MKSLFSAFVSILFLSVFSSYSRTAVIEPEKREHSGLEDICGDWEGRRGRKEITLFLEMEAEGDSLSIGELRTDTDEVYSLECSADDIDKDDAYAVGPDGPYTYCISEWNAGERVGIYYLLLENGDLKGVYVAYDIVFDVNLRRTEAADDEKWARTVDYGNRREAYESYMKEFPEGKHIKEARDSIMSIDDRCAWEKASDENTIAAYREYLESDAAAHAYSSQAKARIASLKLEDHYASGDLEAALAVIDEMERNNIRLSDRDEEIKEAIRESTLYRKYLDSDTDDEKIQNGIAYVNECLYAENRPEVMDEIARLMASSDKYLAGTPVEVMQTYATTEETRQYVAKEYEKYRRQRSRTGSKSSKVGFNGGFGATFETPNAGFSPIFGGHFLFSIGDNRNFLNLELGVRYRYWQFGELVEGKGDMDFHHIRLIAAPKFNIVRQRKSAFYMYLAPEIGYGYPIDMHGTGFYNANSLSMGGRIGVGIGRFDLSALYTYDYVSLVNDTFPGGRYGRQQLGLALSFYFSGSGRSK